jgi:MarR family 2-MHQ and catechol resistance regulon transcriptional repressor
VTGHGYDDPRITAIGLLVEAYAGISGRLAAQLAEHALAPIEFEVLLRLARSPRCQLRMTDLAAQTQLTTSGITRVVDRMERGGLICRSACPTDRRSSFAVVTEAGLSRLDEVLPGHVELIERWFTGRLSAEQLRQVLDGLRIIRDATRPGSTSGTAAATSGTTGATSGTAAATSGTAAAPTP